MPSHGIHRDLLDTAVELRAKAREIDDVRLAEYLRAQALNLDDIARRVQQRDHRVLWLYPQGAIPPYSGDAA